MEKLTPLILFCFPSFPEATPDGKRRALLVIIGTMLAAASAVPVSIMLLAIGSTFNALTSALSFFPMMLTLVILRLTQSTTMAGNYLTLCVTIAVVADLGPDNGFSLLAMLAVPIVATHLIGAKAGIIWTSITIAIVMLFGQQMAGTSAIHGYELAATTAFMAALIGIGSAVIDYILTSESDRSVTSANRVQAQQEKLRHFLNATFQGFLEIDNEVVVYESDGIQQLAQKKLGRLKHQNLAQLVHPGDYEQLREQMISSKQNGFRQELRFKSADGHWVWLELYAISEPFDQKWLFAVRDFANEHESKRRRENTERLQSVGLLAAGIAHDFNNLLTVIVGFSEQFPEGVEKKHVIEAATRASELANRLVIFGKPDPGKISLIDFAAMIRNWEPLLTSVLGEEVTFHCQVGAQPVWVAGNESQLQQILLNIVKNAKEAMPRGGDFSLSLLTENLSGSNPYDVPAGDYVTVKLADNGIGMEEEILNLIFDPYYSTKSPGSGRGLGLSSVYATLKQHEGGIAISSEAGQGTQISIALPWQPGPVAINEPGSSRRLSQIKERPSVLVVEDEEMIRTLIQQALESNGYQVTLASDGHEGVRRFQSMDPPPSILITDVVMPEMRGSDLARELRRFSPALLVLFVSGYSAMEIGRSDLDVLNTAFLAKPFRMAQLLDRLEQLQLSSVENEKVNSQPESQDL